MHVPLSSRWSCFVTYSSVYQRSLPDFAAVSSITRMTFRICTRKLRRTDGAEMHLKSALCTHVEVRPSIRMTMTEAAA